MLSKKKSFNKQKIFFSQNPSAYLHWLSPRLSIIKMDPQRIRLLECLPAELHRNSYGLLDNLAVKRNSKKEGRCFGPAHERTVRASVNGERRSPAAVACLGKSDSYGDGLSTTSSPPGLSFSRCQNNTLLFCFLFRLLAKSTTLRLTTLLLH